MSSRQNWAVNAVLAGMAVLLVALLVVAKGLRSDLNDQRALSLASRRSRINFQAKQTFLLCSRKPTLVSVEIAPDVHRACVGYRTLAQAKRTEAALSPIPK